MTSTRSHDDDAPATRPAGASDHREHADTPGSLPVPPPIVVRDSVIAQEIDLIVNMVVRNGACGLINGPIGIGKTTAAADSAMRLNCQPVYINMFGTTTLRDQMNTIWGAMTGTKGSGTAPVIRDQILDTLKRRPMTLLIDDAHHLHYSALTSILSIYDKIYASRRHGTPIVLIGNNVESHLKQRLPELLGRSGAKCELTPLAGDKLAQFVLAMEPRIAGTDHSTLRHMDNHHFHGDLRRWRQFFEMVFLVRTSNDPAPLTEHEIQRVIRFIPASTR